MPRGRGRSLLAALEKPRRRPEISVGVRKFPWGKKIFFSPEIVHGLAGARRTCPEAGPPPPRSSGRAAAPSGNFRGGSEISVEGEKKFSDGNFPRRRAEGTGTAATRHAHFGPRTRTPGQFERPPACTGRPAGNFPRAPRKFPVAPPRRADAPAPPPQAGPSPRRAQGGRAARQPPPRPRAEAVLPPPPLAAPSLAREAPRKFSVRPPRRADGPAPPPEAGPSSRRAQGGRAARQPPPRPRAEAPPWPRRGVTAPAARRPADGCCARAAMQPPRHRGDRRASRCAAAGPCGRRRALAGLRAARKGRKAEAAADDAAERRARKGRRSRRRHLPGCRARGRCRPAPRDLAAPGRLAAHAKQLAMRSCETARTSARAPPCSAARGGAAEPARACRVRRRAGPPAGALQGGGGRRDDTKAGRPLVERARVRGRGGRWGRRSETADVKFCVRT